MSIVALLLGRQCTGRGMGRMPSLPRLEYKMKDIIVSRDGQFGGDMSFSLPNAQSLVMLGYMSHSRIMCYHTDTDNRRYAVVCDFDVSGVLRFRQLDFYPLCARDESEYGKSHSSCINNTFMTSHRQSQLPQHEIHTSNPCT